MSPSTPSSDRGSRPSQVTLADVARRVNLSKSSVSRVLRGVPGTVSDETARRVHAAARELGYVPNALAASLSHRRTLTVGLVLPDIGNPFFAGVVASIEQTLQGSGYSLILTNTANSPDAEHQQTRMLLERRVDALVVAPSGQEDEHLREVQRHGLAVVLIDAHPRQLDFDCVMADNREGAASAMTHLMALGHRHIGIVNGPWSSSSSRERLEGARAAAGAAGAGIDHELVREADFTLRGGYARAAELLARSPRPTALLVMNNLMTVGAIAAIRDAGLRIPADISLAGFDDMEWYPFADPPITAVAQPADVIGVEATRALLARIAREAAARPRLTMVPTELRVRRSTAAPAHD